MVSKPLDGINGPENNNNKRRQSKQNQEKNVKKVYICETLTNRLATLSELVTTAI